MAGSSKDSDDSQQFPDVFNKVPFEELMTRCDIITTANIIGWSKLHLDLASYSATLHDCQPFGLPCVLHSNPTEPPWRCNEYFEGKGTMCKLTALDRFSSNAVMPNCKGKVWAGANGDWIAAVGDKGTWHLANVYTRRQIPLPQISLFEATNDPLTFSHDNMSVRFRKIAICKVPIAAAAYSDFYIIAIFDNAIDILEGDDYAWTVLQNQFLRFSSYIDAIIHQGVMFAVSEMGNVYAWDPLHFGPILLWLPRNTNLWVGDLDDVEDPGLWFLARSIDGDRLLLVHTRRVVDERCYPRPSSQGYIFADRSFEEYYGRTVRTYSTVRFGCEVFSKDTSQLHPVKPWEEISNLGAYSLFLGLNYPLNIVVGGADVAPGYLTRSYCVYTSYHTMRHANVLGYCPSPEICPFNLNCKEAAVGFSTNIHWSIPQALFWFIPSFANALDWNLDVSCT